MEDLNKVFRVLRKYNIKLNLKKRMFGVVTGKFIGFIVSQKGIEVNSEKIQTILNIQPLRTVKDVQKLNRPSSSLKPVHFEVN